MWFLVLLIIKNKGYFIKRRQAELCFRAINIKTVNEQYSDEEDQLWDSLFDEVRHLNKVGTGGGNSGYFLQR
jgi:hypothetical protein